MNLLRVYYIQEMNAMRSLRKRGIGDSISFIFVIRKVSAMISKDSTICICMKKVSDITAKNSTINNEMKKVSAILAINSIVFICMNTVSAILAKIQ